MRLNLPAISNVANYYLHFDDEVWSQFANSNSSDRQVGRFISALSLPRLRKVIQPIDFFSV